MNRRTLTSLAVLGALILADSPLPLSGTAHAQTLPSVALDLSFDSVEQETAITVTMSFGGLDFDSDTSDTDYVFRADVIRADAEDADAIDADVCEGPDMGHDRYMYKVDEAPETRTAGDDFEELPWDGNYSVPGWFWYGYVLCADVNADGRPDATTTIPELDWKSAE